MTKLKVYLGIGYPTATHEDVIEIDDQELADCETDEEREELCQQYWKDWSNNYIEGWFELEDS